MASAFGSIYNNGFNVVTLTANTPFQVTMPQTMPGVGVTYTPANSITVSETGTYWINYYLTAASSSVATLSLTVRQNGVDIAPSRLSHILVANEESYFAGTVIVALDASDVLDMVIESNTSITVSAGGGTNASLSVMRLNT